MKYAAAMKYGGELICAAECDYSAFKQLVPLCPNCKEPVHLKAGGDRVSVKGKPYKIGAHWSHFQGKSAEQIAQCEQRVNGYSPKDKQRIAAKARGQRLKMLQRWFWTVVQQSPALDGIFLQKDHLTSCFGESKAASLLKVLLKKARSSKFQYANVINSLSLQAYHALVVKQSNSMSPRCFEHMSKLLATECVDEAIFKRHKKIAGEAFLYLLSNTNAELQEGVFLGSAAIWIQSNYDAPEYDKVLRISAQDTDSMIIQALMQLMTVPWATEFQRLGNLSHADAS